VVGKPCRIARLESRVPDAIRIDDRVGAVETWAETATIRDQGVASAVFEEREVHRRDQRDTTPRTASRLTG
jgi:hypothetical protein